MSTLHTIVVTSRPTAVVKAQAPAPATYQGKPSFAAAKVRHRYRAEFTAGPFKGEAVDGFPTSDEALGTLVRNTATLLHSAEAIFEFLASLFDNCQVRGANETLGRALRFACRNPMRKNPGLTLQYVSPPNQPRKAPASAPAAVEGGAA